MARQTALLGRTSSQTILKRWSSVVFAGLLLITIGLIYYQASWLGIGRIGFEIEEWSRKPGVSQLNISRLNPTSSKTGNGAIKQYPACPIPQLEPYHESIQHLLHVEIPPHFNCSGSYPLLFNSTLQSTIVPAKGPDYFRDEGYESCCYRTVVRDDSSWLPDDSEILSPQCFPVNLTAETKVPDGHEFIAIFCKRKGQNETKEILADVHAFVHLKPGSNGSSNGEMENKFNVVIFGLDAMSRMNFLRTMPQSYSFLKNELEAVEMFGYNKVGENTLPNLSPLLMSGMPSDFNNCRFDDCPLIWKEYSKEGYYTMYSEDGSIIALFNTPGLGNGFQRQPTDYYPRPLTHFADTKYTAHDRNLFNCYGPRLTFQHLLDYMEKYVDTMSRNKKNFFQFSWSNGLTHDVLNAPRLGDPHLLKSLRWLKESGYLKKTIFILMSDHGQRMDTIRNTIQGQLEDRLPFLYFLLPETFKRKYPRAYRNLLSNADKLVTTYDLHETLKELLSLDVIENRKLLDREDELTALGGKLTRRISLFLPIPEFRTCEMAGISMIFCSCTYMEVVNVTDPEINEVANVAVFHINSILGVNNTNINSPCAHLELQNVTMTRRAGFSEDKWTGYLINFETKPGGAQFEALVGKDISNEEYWTVQGPVVRTNRYGSQSHCVQNIKLKPYCYCF